MVNEGSTVGSKGGIVRMPQLVPLRGGSRNFSGEVFINLQVLLLDDVFRPFEWRGAFQGLPDILWRGSVCAIPFGHRRSRSEEHTSELHSPCKIVCRLLLVKKKKKNKTNNYAQRLP